VLDAATGGLDAATGGVVLVWVGLSAVMVFCLVGIDFGPALVLKIAINDTMTSTGSA